MVITGSAGQKEGQYLEILHRLQKSKFSDQKRC